MKILMTGGPVYGYLDSVKIITNKFKGGRIARLADRICDMGHEVYYLCSKESTKPECVSAIITYDGFEEYKEKVLSMAPKFDAIVLGAAVANLIPNSPWRHTKFPSHNYKEGDKINIEFVVAPRVINAVKKVSPNTTLIGFKLLTNVAYEELIEAAYKTLIESNANFVIANDSANLDSKFIVTKEKSVITLHEDELPQFINLAVKDRHYKTILRNGYSGDLDFRPAKYDDLCAHYCEELKSGFDIKRNMLFGCVAIRTGKGFVISSRGKENMLSTSYVENVDHDKLELTACGTKKASLNAPLIDHIFKMVPAAQAVVHYHRASDLKTLPYAFPGTVRDSLRYMNGKSFCIENHGTFLLLDSEGRTL